MTKCPGQDTRYWDPEDIRDEICPYCGNTIEFWKTDIRVRCDKCKKVVSNPNFNLGCAAWCSFAEQCLGDVKKGYTRPDSIRQKIEEEAERLLKDEVLKEFKEALKRGEEISEQRGEQFLVIALSVFLNSVKKSFDRKEAEAKIDKALSRLGLPFLASKQARQVIEELESGELKSSTGRAVYFVLYNKDIDDEEKGGEPMSKKVKREIIKIDEDLCDGCGQCVPACAEGALQIVDGKARLVKENYCDGLGACLGDCPQGAISIEVREAEAFDEQAVEKHLQSMREGRAREFDPKEDYNKSVRGADQDADTVECAACTALSGEIKRKEKEVEEEAQPQTLESRLSTWPIKIKLVAPQSPFLQKTHLLITADCVPFAFADFHRRFLKDNTLLIGCPKLDDADFYHRKLVEIFKNFSYEKVTVINMEIACCVGLFELVKKARTGAEAGFIIENIMISVDGEVKDSNEYSACC